MALSSQFSTLAKSTTTPGFGFGTTSTTTGGNAFTLGANNASAGGGLNFGTMNQPSTTFGFGANQPAATTSTSFGFGTNNQTTQPATATTNFGFGSQQQPANTTTGFGFGANLGANAPTQQQGFGTSFGMAQPNAATGFGFGSKPTTGFGSIGTNTNTGFGFGAGTNAFGNTNTGGFGMQSANQFGTGGVSWVGAQRLQEIRMSYAPHLDQNGQPVPEGYGGVRLNRHCEFLAEVYVPIDSQQNQNVKLANANPRRWNLVDRDNPDPEHLEPIIETGGEALRRRFTTQQNEVAKLKEYATELTNTLSVIDKSSKKISLKFETLQQKQKKLFHQLLLILRKIELLRRQGDSIDQKEYNFRECLEKIAAGARNPHAKLLELMTIQTQYDQNRVDLFDEKLNEADELKLVAIIDKQRKGLQHLTDILNKDLRDLALLKRVIEENSVNK